VERISDQISGAINSAYLHSELERESAESTILADLSRIVGSSLDIEIVYGRLISEVRNLISFNQLLICTVDAGQLTATSQCKWTDGFIEVNLAEAMPLAATILEGVVRDRRGTIIQNLPPKELAQKYPATEQLVEEGMLSFLIVPLMSDDRVIGTLCMASEIPVAYSDHNLDLMERVGFQIANSIANADLYRRRADAEALVTASEAKFRGRFSSAPDATIIVDASGKIRYSNSQTEDTFGYDQEELLGKSVADLIPEDRRGAHTTEMSTYVLSPKLRELSRDLAISGLRKDSSTFPAEIKLSPLNSDDGLLIICVVRDVSERIRLKQQLLQSQKMDAIGQLAGGVAHDFNNVLTAIIGNVQLALMMGVEDNNTRNRLQNIQTASDRAAGLTRQLLAFSRQQEVEPRLVNLNAIVMDMDNMVRRLIGEDIELTTLPIDELGTTNIDPGQFEQILMNLVANARDAMPNGGRLAIVTSNVYVDEKLAREHHGIEQGEFVVLTVTDTGTGIPDAIVPRIFEPFFTTKEIGSGTGLGLSTCYGIATQHGGFINVETQIGKGTSFTVHLPIADHSVQSLPIVAEPDELPMGKETILVVEDEPLVRAVVCDTLTRQGYSVLDATNGVDALRILNEVLDQQVDLMLTDVVMPLMSGTELADKMREIRPEIKVMYTSGYNDDSRIPLDSAEFEAIFLRKPFNLRDLIFKVRNVLDSPLTPIK
jgi:hypothetical protein